MYIICITVATDRRAHVWTPITQWSRMPSSAWKKKKKKKKTKEIKKQKKQKTQKKKIKN